MNKSIFDNLAKLFNAHGFRLYIIGGTSRDYLLNKESKDYDFATDATPDDMRLFLPDCNYAFSRFGTVKLKIDNIHIDVTTLRKEDDYIDFRHPKKIIFTKDISLDYKRRDFTINAIYIDENYKIYDFCHGIDDLNNRIIRFIGDPDKRVKEDPLRILRAKRFKQQLGFEIEPNSLLAIEKNKDLIDKLNPDKIKEELAKIKN